ncbi:hypothetical protein JTB14_014117 [Gonioctena quinquepunctata]|nr:hypothetical protein JTB14_014117 [Gonioctena quinquepunctata]
MYWRNSSPQSFESYLQMDVEHHQKIVEKLRKRIPTDNVAENNEAVATTNNTGSLPIFVENFMKNRKYPVRIEDKLSEKHHLDHRSPPGV